MTTGDPKTPCNDGGIFRPDELFTATVNTIGVADLDEPVEKIKATGGRAVTPNT